MNIVEEVLAGSKRALARAITAVENEYDEAAEIMKNSIPIPVMHMLSALPAPWRRQKHPY